MHPIVAGGVEEEGRGGADRDVSMPPSLCGLVKRPMDESVCTVTDKGLDEPGIFSSVTYATSNTIG